ncbi:MAG: tetratricopeptide repeat protein [Hahellaceae bacterium]|nr:tetratricopeptide repeat protein [Hahellaceae bacterium]
MNKSPQPLRDLNKRKEATLRLSERLAKIIRLLLACLSFTLLTACANFNGFGYFGGSETEGDAGVSDEPKLFSELLYHPAQPVAVGLSKSATSATKNTLVGEAQIEVNLVQDGLASNSEPNGQHADFHQRLADVNAAIDNYQQVLALLSPDESLSAALILGELYMRKADLLIAGPDELTGENKQPDDLSALSQNALDDTIKHYEWALASYFPGDKLPDATLSLNTADSALNRPSLAQVHAHLYYQLANALALRQSLDQSTHYLTSLTSRYPQSDYYVEAQFRRGEYYFSLQDYSLAALAFTEASTDKQHALYDKSLYMLGWSVFKSGDFNRTLETMTAYLDVIAARHGYRFTQAPGDSADRAVMQDAVRVMVFSFGYQDGVNTLNQHFQRFPGRAYEATVYDYYINMLAQQNRRSEAIAIAHNFVERHPDAALAPMFYSRSISLSQGQLGTAAVMEQKARFVALYGLNGIYGITEPVNQPIVHRGNRLARDNRMAANALDEPFDLQKTTATYLKELANDHYIAATHSKKRNGNKNTSSKSNEETTALYIKAAAYYDEYITTFPLNSDLYEMYYLLGESLYGAQLWQLAAVAYQTTAYVLSPNDYSADAGYAVIKTREKIIASLDTHDQPRVIDEKNQLLEAKVRYVQTFAQQPNALLVAASAMELAAQLGKDDAVVSLADGVLAQLDTVSEGVKKQQALYQSVLINKTNALFRLQQYPEAERNAKQTLLIMSPTDPKRSELENLLAAAIYKQADAIADVSGTDVSGNAGATAGAVQRLLEIVAVAPNSTIAPVALYDAAAMTLAQSQWAVAADLFERFLTRYPNHELAQQIPERLVYSYEQEGRWEQAAQWLTVLATHAQTDTEKAAQLFRAATFYEKSGNQARAIALYRDYAHQYPDPIGAVMQARLSLITMYGERGERDKQEFWVSKVLTDYNRRVDQVDEQAMLVVREVALQQADWRYESYRKTTLSFPLNRTIKQKKEALTAVVAAYETVANVGDQTQINQAVFRIGEIYQGLANEIMAAETPSSLNELEKSQYDILLEELAYPFEEQAITVYAVNVSKIPQGVYDHWIKQSMKSLGKLMPARYEKIEQGGQYSDQLF